METSRSSEQGLKEKSFAKGVEREQVSGLSKPNSRVEADVCAADGSNRQSSVMNPFVDWGFKYLFGTERNKRNLVGFLNLVLELECPIVDVEYLNNENIPHEAGGRECVFDVLCIDKSGTRFLIEVQNAPISYIRNRILYYTCRLIEQMGQPGEKWNYNIDKVYSICLMNFMYEQDPVLKREFMLQESYTGTLFTDRIHIVMLQLPCLEAKSMSECNMLYEKLLYLLLQMKKGMSTIEELKRQVYEHGLNEEIRETFLNVLDEANLASLSKSDKALYEARLKSYRDNRACLDYAIETGIRQGIEHGIEKGIKQGIKQGIEQGIEQGIKQGLAEGVAQGKLEIARSMKNKGLDIGLIAECTGLSGFEIEKL